MADVEIDTNVKDFTNRNNFGVVVCTSGTRPTAVNGKAIYETDTDLFLIYDGAAWQQVGGGVTDHGALTGLADDDHSQYLLVSGSRAMTGNLSMGTNNVYLDSGVLRISDGTTLSGSIGFTTGVQNFIQRQLYSGSDYTLLSDQDYMHTWAILGTEKMHLSTADGLKLFTKINMNGLKIEGVLDPTANQEAATKKYVDDNISGGDFYANGSVAMTGDLNLAGNDINNVQELYIDVLDVDDYDAIELRTHIIPGTDSLYSLGTNSDKFANIYADDLHVSSLTYMRDNSGDMELHVATGQAVKIVVG